MDKVVIILRGASCAGKSTVASYLASLKPGAVVCTADDYFYDENGVYTFERSKLREAHTQCREKFVDAIAHQSELVIVANTNTTEKEFGFYKDAAEHCGYKVIFLVVEKRHDGTNTHNCPEAGVAMQDKNIRHSLKLR